MDTTPPRTTVPYNLGLIYSLVYRAYVITAGIGTFVLGFAQETVSDLFLGTLSYRACLGLCGLGALLLLGDAIRTQAFGTPPSRFRHIYFFMIAFGWAVPLYAVPNNSLDLQLFWIANIWLLMAMALVDAHERGNLK